nr:hypothetical protein [Tanacetum cinerariifolium]
MIKLYNAYEIQPNVMQSSTKGPSLNVGDEDEVDKKELIDEDIKKLVKSSTSAEVHAAEEKKGDKDESDDDIGFSLID